jgi:hypothetical protein
MQALGVLRAAPKRGRFDLRGGWVIFGAINIALLAYLLLRAPLAPAQQPYHTPECVAAFDHYIMLASATNDPESAAQFNYREVRARVRAVSRAMKSMLGVCRRRPT